MQLCTTSLVALMQLMQVEAWECGIGPVSGAISYVIAFPVDLVGVDRCCIEHDELIDALNVAREEADHVFCHCLATKDSWYIRYIVKPLFCTSVMLYTKWFESGKAEEPFVKFQ